MTKTVILDIGTHKAQELKVLSSYKPFIYYHYLRWFVDFIRRLLTYRQSVLSTYGEGNYQASPLLYGFKEHIRILLGIHSVSRQDLRQATLIAIDPQSHLTYHNIPKQFKSPIVLSVALNDHTDASESCLKPFSIARNTLSSSFNLPTSKLNRTTLVPNLLTTDLLRDLARNNVLNKSDSLILRLNCEGSELAIIKEIIHHDYNLKLVIGSIFDVKKKFGTESFDNLLTLLESNNVNLLYFKGTDPSTWLSALNSFSRALNPSIT